MNGAPALVGLIARAPTCARPLRRWGGVLPPELAALPTPCYLLDEGQLARNAELLGALAARTGCKVLLAQKAFSNYDLYPLLAPHLAGTEASGLFEARLAPRRCPAGKCMCSAQPTAPARWEELLRWAIISCSTRPPSWPASGLRRGRRARAWGLRVNPELLHPGRARHLRPLRSRQPPGRHPRPVGRRPWPPTRPAELLDGLHFHTLCEQDADALAVTLDAVAEKFGDLLPRMQWLNFGGGAPHHPPGATAWPRWNAASPAHSGDWGVTVYLEPGEACALNAGYLLTRVLDVVRNGDTTIAILDASAACHMPDVLEMPYRPPLLYAADAGQKPCTVRLAGPTCLAGDVIGDYSFDAPAPSRRPAGVRGHGHLHHLQEQHLQRHAAARHLGARRRGRLPGTGAFRYEDFKYRLGSQR